MEIAVETALMFRLGLMVFGLKPLRAMLFEVVRTKSLGRGSPRFRSQPNTWVGAASHGRNKNELARGIPQRQRVRG
jgi:hypothetical protein